MGLEGVMIHPQSLVESENVGAGTKVWEFTHVMQGAVIGRNCNICAHCFVENGAVIGDNVVLKNGVYVWNGVTIEDDAFVGPNVTFTNEREPRAMFPKELAHTRVRKGASLGAGCVLVAPVTIGAYATVGAGSVVTRDVGPHELVCGNPAVRRGHVCVCGRRVGGKPALPGTAATCACGRELAI